VIEAEFIFPYLAHAPSNEKPTGVGDPGVAPIGPAAANALARLGHNRPGLPIVRGTV
jgi:isoquinoline 1-oxidoreductase subunit beta